MPGAAAADVAAPSPDAPAPLSWPVEAPTSREEGRLHGEQVDALGEAIARLSAHITAATYRLLVMIRVFDEAEGWHRQGFTSCAAWLSWLTGDGPGTAREKVRVPARALKDLPALSQALRAGELSYSVARAVTRVATPENDAKLVEAARHSTAAQRERLVSAWRSTDRAEEAVEDERERHRYRELTVVRDAADGSYVVRGRLDPEAGAALCRALEARDGGRCVFPGCGSRFCDAHHLTPWAEGGETSLENLALLCRRHHRRVHEDGWTVERDEDGELRFLRPDGRRLPEVAPPAPVPEDPVAALEREQAELGIDASTATPRWDGVEMDVDWALFVLRDQGREELGGHVSAETSGGVPGAGSPDADANSNVSAERSGAEPRCGRNAAPVSGESSDR